MKVIELSIRANHAAAIKESVDAIDARLLQTLND